MDGFIHTIKILMWRMRHAEKLINRQVFDIPSVFFITVPYMVNNIDESHIFGQ